MASQLPTDMLIEIFKILPIICILRCRCVQKSWYYVIQSPIFVNVHMKYNMKNHKYLLFHSFWNSKFLSLRFDDETCEKYQSLQPLPGMPELVDFTENNFMTWYATSNGLICLSKLFTVYKPEHYNSKIFVWNPTVRKVITLPDAPRLDVPVFGDYCQVKLAFRFFPESLDYKVVKIVHDGYYKNRSEATLVDVYTRSTNSWKTISQDNVIRPLYFDGSDGVFVGAVAFWLGGGKIVCFDTENDVMRGIAVPELTDDTSFSIRAFGESLALFARNVNFTILDMWVLEGGLTNNEIVWEKKFNFCLQVENRCRFEALGLNALGFRNNGEVLLRQSNKLISYNVEHDEIKYFAKPIYLLIHDEIPFLAEPCRWYVEQNMWHLVGENSLYPFPENLALLGCG